MTVVYWKHAQHITARHAGLDPVPIRLSPIHCHWILKPVQNDGGLLETYTAPTTPAARHAGLDPASIRLAPIHCYWILKPVQDDGGLLVAI
jgi:hypothetical protein